MQISSELQLKREQEKQTQSIHKTQSLFNSLECIKCEIMFINALSRRRIFCLPIRHISRLKCFDFLCNDSLGYYLKREQPFFRKKLWDLQNMKISSLWNIFEYVLMSIIVFYNLIFYSFNNMQWYLQWYFDLIYSIYKFSCWLFLLKLWTLLGFYTGGFEGINTQEGVKDFLSDQLDRP